MSPRPERLSDPGNTVATRLDRRRGLRTQANTDAEVRDLQRSGGVDRFKEFLTNLVIRGKLTIQKQADRALEIKNDQGITQFLVGTQQEVNGQATPFFLIGGNVADVFTFGMKVFGFNGDILAPNGFLQTKTHNFARWASGVHHVPGGTTLEVVGMAAWTASTITNADDSDGSWARFDTTASSGNATGCNGGTGRFRTDQGIEALFRIKTGGAISSSRIWVGLFSGDPSATDSPTSLNFAGFRYSTGAGDTNWQAVTGNGSAVTVADNFIAVAANQTYYLRLRLTDTQAQFVVGLPGINDGFTNGTWTQNITTTLPSASTLLTPRVALTTLTAGVRFIRFGFANFLTR